VGSWQYNILRRWIEAGSLGVKPDEAEFEALDVEPREIVSSAVGAAAQLRIVVRWSDGSREDVTPLCRFRSNDESVATIDENGEVIVTGKGDTDVVAFYDKGVVAVPVMAPISELVGERYPDVPTPTKIDELIVSKLRKLGIVPSDLCSDEEFLRRASLDATGTLPLPDEVTAFIADASPDKRVKKIDELLARSTYSAWWATKLCDITGDNEQNTGEQRFRRRQAEQWYEWIYDRVEQNVAYDKLVEGIVLATGRRAGQSFEEYAAEMNSFYRPENPANFSARETMPHYWSRRQFDQAKDKAITFSYAFLGVRLQCAECHKHPFDQWTKQDFQQFSAFFDRVAYGYAPDAKAAVKAMQDGLDLRKLKDKKEAAKLVADGKVLPWKEVFVRRSRPPGGKAKIGKAAKKNVPPAGRVITPKLLGGEEVMAERYSDPREALMEWMRGPGNPYFARAWVNRVWANYFNVGIVDPPDDMNLAKPARSTNCDCERSNEPSLLQTIYLRNDQSMLDLLDRRDGWLRQIDSTGQRPKLEARQTRLRDTLAATEQRIEAAQHEGDSQQIKGLQQQAKKLKRQAEQVAHALQQQKPRNGDSQQVAVVPGEVVREAYLRVLSRLPRDDEQQVAMRYLSESETLATGMKDLVWALLNTKEFIVNR
jgi:hypothetical protein